MAKLTDNRVLVKRCEEYERDRILTLVEEGMRELDYAPSGKVYVKPNVVTSSKGGRYGTAMYTDPALGRRVAGGAVPGAGGDAGRHGREFRRRDVYPELLPTRRLL